MGLQSLLFRAPTPLPEKYKCIGIGRNTSLFNTVTPSRLSPGNNNFRWYHTISPTTYFRDKEHVKQVSLSSRNTVVLLFYHYQKGSVFSTKRVPQTSHLRKTQCTSWAAYKHKSGPHLSTISPSQTQKPGSKQMQTRSRHPKIWRVMIPGKCTFRPPLVLVVKQAFRPLFLSLQISFKIVLKSRTPHRPY